MLAVRRRGNLYQTRETRSVRFLVLFALQMTFISDRESRCGLPLCGESIDVSARPGGIKLPQGQVTQHVFVRADGSMVIDPAAYLDDVISVLLYAALLNPIMDEGVRVLLARTLDRMDARAVARHGYSGSEADRTASWISVEMGLAASTARRPLMNTSEPLSAASQDPSESASPSSRRRF